MHRILISPEAVCGRTVTIHDPKALHHCINVLRIKAGEPVECFDGQGCAWRGTVQAVERRQLSVRISESRREPFPRCAVELYPALISPERFSWLVEKATELGAAAIQPVITQRTEHGRQAVGASRLQRWRRVAESAAMQCGRLTVPQIGGAIDFSRALEHAGGASIFIPTLLGSQPQLLSAIDAACNSRRIALFIGPEGDFTASEVEQAQSHAAVAVSLGRLTLRAETAAVAALALVSAALEKP